MCLGVCNSTGEFKKSLFSCRQSAVQAAAAAASQINQKLGAGNMNVQPPNVPMGMGPHAGLGAVVNIEWCVPDKMVGLSKYLNSSYLFNQHN